MWDLKLELIKTHESSFLALEEEGCLSRLKAPFSSYSMTTFTANTNDSTLAYYIPSTNYLASLCKSGKYSTALTTSEEKLQTNLLDAYLKNRLRKLQVKLRTLILQHWQEEECSSRPRDVFAQKVYSDFSSNDHTGCCRPPLISISCLN